MKRRAPRNTDPERRAQHAAREPKPGFKGRLPRTASGIRRSLLVGCSLSSLMFLPCCGTDGQAIHASEATPTPRNPDASSTPNNPSASVGLNVQGSLLRGAVILDESWVTADTIGELYFKAQNGRLLELQLAHTSGTVEARGIDIPPDTWLTVDGALNDDWDQVYGSLEASGHTLEIDADIYQVERTGRLQLRGYLIVDMQGEVWVEFDEDP